MPGLDADRVVSVKEKSNGFVREIQPEKSRKSLSFLESSERRQYHTYGKNKEFKILDVTVILQNMDFQG